MKYHTEFDPLVGRAIDRLILEIPAGRCSWYTASAGGCTMCGFNGPASAKTRFTIRGKPWQNWIARAYIRRMLSKGPDGLVVLAVFHGGSFFNPDEVPIVLQHDIAAKVRTSPRVARLLVESRCEYITDQNLSRLLESLQGKELEVGIGLESVTDRVRNGILNKGLDLREYERALKTLRAHGVASFTYVFLKPPGLTENESIAECIETVQYAFDAGSAVVSVSCGTVESGTKLYDVWRTGAYRPPWLWSIVEVIRRCRHIGPLRVSTFDDEPMPVDYPRNCGKCDLVVNTSLEDYRLTMDTASISDARMPICDCKNEWSRCCDGILGYGESSG